MPFVEIDKQVYGRIERIAAITDTKINKVIKTALLEWLEITGDPLLDFLSATGSATDSRTPNGPLGPATSLLATGEPERMRVDGPKYFLHQDAEE